MSNNPTIVFRNPGDVVIEDRPTPSPGRGELLIQTHRTLISTGTELTILGGDFPSQSAWADYGKFPFEPGYNNVGVVTEVGEDINPEWLGRRVASYGAHAAYVKASVQTVHQIPSGLSDEQAVFFTIAEIVMNGVRRGFASLKQQGRFVVLSSPQGPTSFDFHDLCNAPSFTAIGYRIFGLVLPLVKPAVATVAVFIMIPVWNDLWFPLILAPGEATKTVTLGAQQFLGQFVTDWNAVLSSLTLAMLPILILYIIFSQQLIRGLTTGAVK